jgi:hypothetical protein
MSKLAASWVFLVAETPQPQYLADKVVDDAGYDASYDSAVIGRDVGEILDAHPVVDYEAATQGALKVCPDTNVVGFFLETKDSFGRISVRCSNDFGGTKTVCTYILKGV